MDLNTTLKEVEKLYTTNLQKFGMSSKSVGWNSPECQRLRFQKLAALIQQEQAVTVNDLGCGYGAMYLFFQETKASLSKYWGYDISEPMLIEAKKIMGNDPKAEWLQYSTLHTLADYSFASGIFNVKFQTEEKEWKQFMLDTLHSMNDHSSQGFAFNVLSSYVDWKESHLYYADPCYFFDYCKKNFSKKVTLLHDYPLWEWTILVHK